MPRIRLRSQRHVHRGPPKHQAGIRTGNAAAKKPQTLRQQTLGSVIGGNTNFNDRNAPVTQPDNQGAKQEAGQKKPAAERATQSNSGGTSTDSFAVKKQVFLAEAAIMLDDLDLADLATVIRLRPDYGMIDADDLEDISEDFMAICERKCAFAKVRAAIHSLYQNAMDATDLANMMTAEEYDELEHVASLTQD